MSGKTRKEERNVLHALLPGAKVENGKGRKISVNLGFCRDIVRFNVGGTNFETYRSTLFKQPNSPLAYDNFLKDHYRADTDDYFFDRDPEVFRSILNYLRTGFLHLPSYMCGPAIREELQFWGIDETSIERCCWTHYNSWNKTLKALDRLDRDRKGSYLNDANGNNSARGTTWGKWQSIIWNILNKPASSIKAKVYAWISLFFVVLSIFSFVVETHPFFSYVVYVSNITGSPLPTTRSDVSNMTNTSYITNSTHTTQNGKEMKVTHPVFNFIDLFCLAFFSLEYILRIIFSRRKFRYATSMMGVIDLCAILPDYVQLIIYAFRPEYRYNGYVGLIAILRIARVLRVFRLIRHVPGLWILLYTLKSSLRELLLLAVFMMVGMLVFSSLIYFVDDQETFISIPHGFWWALVTMTTVGYGDMVPKTPWGYVVGSLTALSGLLMMGFSVPVLVNNFILYYKHVQFIVREEGAECRKQESKKSEATENGQHCGNSAYNLDTLQRPTLGK